MRSLLLLLILTSFVWLICRYFYSLGKKDAFKGPQQEGRTAAGRKKVDSFVIENENRSSRGDDKQ